MDRSKLKAFMRGEIEPDDFARQVFAAREEERKQREQEEERRREERLKRREEMARRKRDLDEALGVRQEDRAISIYAEQLVKMRAQLNGEAAPDRLHYWFLMDSWTPNQAFAILAGYCPQSLQFDDDGKLVSDYRGEYGGLVWLSGLELDGFFTDMVVGEDFKKRHKRAFEENLKAFNDIWKTGAHTEPRYHPSYYLDWANRKRIKIQWLDWARSEGLLPWEEKQAAVTASGEVSGKAESNYLNLIGALCELYWRAAHGDAPIVQQRILDVLSEYKDYPGLSERNLKDKISRALKSIQNPK
jgi:hypothetical protein